MKAFVKKEWMEMIRTGKLLILGILFLLFGILNPAIAKMTPWLMEMMQESIKQSGLELGVVTVNAMTSWTQYYKNAPMALLVMVLMSSGILTNEYQNGTLVQVVTKGLSRRKILASKMIMLCLSWTALFLLYFGVTYGYTAYYWGEDKVEGLAFGSFAYWLFGLMILAVLMLFSTISDNAGQVLLGTGSVYVVMLFLNYVPKLQKILPLRLCEGLQLSMGTLKAEDFVPAIICAGAGILVCVMMSVILFDKRRL